MPGLRTHDSVTSLHRPSLPIRDFGVGDGDGSELDDTGGAAPGPPNPSRASRAQRGAMLPPANLAAHLDGGGGGGGAVPVKGKPRRRTTPRVAMRAGHSVNSVMASVGSEL